MKAKRLEDKNSQIRGQLWDRDFRLKYAKQVLDSPCDNWLNKVETDFVQASLRKRRWNAAWFGMVSGVIVLLVSGLAAYFWYQLQLSQLREQAASSENLVENNNPVEGLALAIQTAEQNRSTPAVEYSILPDVKVALSNAVQTIRETNRFQGDSDVPLTAVAFSPDGKRIAVGDRNGKIALWDTTKGKLNEFSCSSETESSCSDNGSQEVAAIAFSRNGKQIISGRNDGRVQMWDLQGNSQLMWKHSKPVRSVAFLANGRIISSSGDGTIYLGESNQIPGRYKLLKKKVEDPNEFSKETVSNYVPSYVSNYVAVSPDGENIAVIRDYEILLGDSQSDTLTLLVENEQEEIQDAIDASNIKSRCSISFVDNQTLLIGQGSCQSAEGRISKHNYEVQEWRISEEKDSISPIRPLLVDDIAIESVATGGGAIAIDGSNNLIQVRQGNRQFALSGHTGDVNMVAFNPTNPNQVVSVSNDSTIRFWDVSDRAKPVQYMGASFKGQAVKGGGWNYDYVTSIAFSPSGDYFALGRRRGTVMLFNAQGQLAELPFEIPTDGDSYARVSTVAFSPDGETIASVSTDNTVRLWDLEGNLRDTIEGPQCSGDSKISPQITAVAFSPDRKSIAFSQIATGDVEACQAHTVQLWDLETKKYLRTLKGHEDKINTLAFSLDGEILASGSSDKTVRLWDAATGQLIGNPLAAHEGVVNSVAFSPKSTSLLSKLLSKSESILISGSEDRAIRFWDLEGKPTGIEILPNAHTSGIKAVLFRDANTIISASSDQTIRFWNLNGSPVMMPLSNRTEVPEASTVALAFNSNTSTLLASINTFKEGGSYVRMFSDITDWQGSLRIACQQFSQHQWLMEQDTAEAEDARTACEKLASNESYQQDYQPIISTGDTSLIATTSDKQLAVEAIASGDFSEAITKLKASLKKKLNDPEARIYLNNARVAEQKHHTLAVSVPFSSDLGAASEMLRGVAHAQEVYNKAAKSSGEMPIKVAIADDRNDPNNARAIAQQLAEDPTILGVVGHYASDVTSAAANVYHKEKLVAISPVSTSITALPKQLGEYVFRTVPNDKDAAESLATHMLKELKKTKAVVFYDSKSEYSQSLYSAFEAAIKAESGQVVKAIDLSNPEADLKTDSLVPDEAEVIALFPSTAVASKSLDVVRANQRKLPVLAGDDMYGTTVLEVTGEQARCMVVAVPWHIGAHKDTEFVETADKLWKADVSWRTAMSYDATKALMAAIQKNPTREGVAEAIRSKNFTAEGSTKTVEFSAGERKQSEIQLVKVVESDASDPFYAGYDYAFIPEPPLQNQTNFARSHSQLRCD